MVSLDLISYNYKQEAYKAYKHYSVPCSIEQNLSNYSNCVPYSYYSNNFTATTI